MIVLKKQNLIDTLTKLPSGKIARIPYSVFAELFPPGPEDGLSKKAALDLASACHCSIENRPDNDCVWFVKEA